MTLKFTGKDIVLTSSPDVVHIKLYEGKKESAIVALNETESMQLLSFLLTVFGIDELKVVGDEDEPDERMLN